VAAAGFGCAIVRTETVITGWFRQNRMSARHDRYNQSDDLEEPVHRLDLKYGEIFPLLLRLKSHQFCELTNCMVYTLIMGRLSKVVLLSLLLILAGVPGTASPLCAQSANSHVHACCMGQEPVAESHCGMASMQSENPCNCKVAPTESAPVPNTPLSSGANDGTVAFRVVSDIAGNPLASIIFTDSNSPHMGKLQNSPLHALLCTFLV
jgi:hypothetical protein